jgi:hypothetical protein
MMQIKVSPNSIFDEGICVESVDGIRLFKFLDVLQSRLGNLPTVNETNTLTDEEQQIFEGLEGVGRG